MKRLSFPTLLFSLALAGLPACSQTVTPIQNLAPLSTLDRKNSPLDALTFGDSASETAHALAPTQSDVVAGALNNSARRLLPFDPPQYDGGKIAFSLRVDPQKQNYVTVKLWGDEKSSELGRLYLFIGGKQVGYRHLGDIEPIDIPEDEAPLLGRFYYSTTPLPLALTKGKTSASLEIRSGGRIWGYGTNYEQYQKVLKQPTRGVYAAYSHTDGFFAPPANEVQGQALIPAKLPVRTSPGVEFVDEAKKRVNNWITGQLGAKDWYLKGNGELRQGHDLRAPVEVIGTLARAYNLAGTVGFRNPQLVNNVVARIDALAVRFYQDPKLEGYDWTQFGPIGDALAQLYPQLQPTLDETFDHDGSATTIPMRRREAWSFMLQKGRDYWRTHRPQYTNQAMHVDSNMYLANKGIRLLEPTKALPEAQMLDYLYQAAGIKPWLGSDTPSGPAKPLGSDFYQLTPKGLTRELGYVGTYGEILPAVTEMVRITDGDPKLRAQLLKIMKARANFRYPAPDGEGFRAMRLEQVVGWRDSHYPGEIVYGDRTVWGQAFTQAPVLNEPYSIGYAQQALEDNQAFAPAQRLQGANFMNLVEGYEFLKTAPKSVVRLPMSEGQPDFVFSDEENGVLALKRGEEKLYVSLYWRARYGINNLARVHLITPRFDHLATVTQQSQFTPSGQFYTRNNRTNMAFTDNMPVPGIDSANAGEIMPIAKIPADIEFRPGDENIYAGKADFYRLQYGPYLIAMNTTRDKTFDLGVASKVSVPELVSGKTVQLDGSLSVKPQSTVVFYLGDLKNAVQLKPLPESVIPAKAPLAGVPLPEMVPVTALAGLPVTLTAPTATIVGNAARLENGGNLGSWNNSNTRFAWLVNFLRPGTYRVVLDYSLKPGSEGNEIQVSIGEKSVSTTLAATKSWGDYQNVGLGQVEVKAAGPMRVVLGANKKAAGFILNLRGVTLSPLAN